MFTKRSVVIWHKNNDATIYLWRTTFAGTFAKFAWAYPRLPQVWVVLGIGAFQRRQNKSTKQAIIWYLRCTIKQILLHCWLALALPRLLQIVSMVSQRCIYLCYTCLACLTIKRCLWKLHKVSPLALSAWLPGHTDHPICTLYHSGLGFICYTCTVDCCTKALL